MLLRLANDQYYLLFSLTVHYIARLEQDQLSRPVIPLVQDTSKNVFYLNVKWYPRQRLLGVQLNALDRHRSQQIPIDTII